jgi:hypothetical protein
VDRRRVRVAYVGAAERGEAVAALRAFQRDLAAVGADRADRAVGADRADEAVCTPAEVEDAEVTG